MLARPAYALALFVAMALSATAQAASWPSLPAACTPERAVKWDSSKSESNQGACHCPPPSMCPTNYDEYSKPALAKMPVQLINRCCPPIEPPKCPAGTPLAGQPVPADGECTPKCPAGTELAGQPQPANGDCNPTKANACPAKFYPNLADTGLNKLANLGTPKDPRKGRDDRVATVGTYTYANGSSFTMKSGGKDVAQGYAVVGHLPQRYNFSIRMWDVVGSVYGWLWIGDWSFYSQATGGVNSGSRKLNEIISAMGAENLTWFGFSVADPKRLANNLVDGAALAEWNGRDRIQVGTSDPNYGYRSNYWKQPALDTQIGAAIEQCRRAQGEYIELDRKMIDGQSCNYMQCRYVYGDTGYESCLTGDVKITLADGKTKAVKDLKLGDVVKGSDGDHKIVASNTYQSALRVFYGINGGGALLTGDHPIRTKAGWKVIGENAAALHAGKAGFAQTPLQVGDVVITDKGDVAVKSIERHAKVDPVTSYNIKIDGNAGFYANGIEVKGFDKMEMKYD